MPDALKTTVSADLTADEIAVLRDLATRRGLDANTVLRQAIATEKVLSDHVGPGDAVLIRKADGSVLKVVFTPPDQA